MARLDPQKLVVNHSVLEDQKFGAIKNISQQVVKDHTVNSGTKRFQNYIVNQSPPPPPYGSQLNIPPQGGLGGIDFIKSTSLRIHTYKTARNKDDCYVWRRKKCSKKCWFDQYFSEPRKTIIAENQVISFILKIIFEWNLTIYLTIVAGKKLIKNVLKKILKK